MIGLLGHGGGVRHHGAVLRRSGTSGDLPISGRRALPQVAACDGGHPQAGHLSSSPTWRTSLGSTGTRMRLPRATLLSRLTGADVAPVVVLEAPPGYGKSWLARRAAGSGVLRLRGELGPLACGGPVTAASVLVDDAHLLSDD